jgi:serine phosphatase RsbU (regulator of sigma subunit)
MATAQRFDLRALLDAVEAASPTAGVDALAGVLATMAAATEVSFLIADGVGGTLVRLARSTTRTGDRAESVAIVDTPAGAALRTQQVQVVPDESEGTWLYAPVTERGDAVGVLELLLPEAPDDVTVANVASAAHALAYVVIADRRHTDLYEWGSRSTPLTLEAEIQRRLLPLSYTCEAAEFSLGGWLVPANEAGGDTFDYALDEAALHVSVTDAMGHGVHAAQLATLAVGSLRNSRRAHRSLLAQAHAANAALAAYAEPDQFVTGQLMRIELATGQVQLINAGHVLPMLVRQGTTTEIRLGADAAFGIDPTTAYTVQELTLEPQDRLVLLTDGMLERNAAEADVVRLLPAIRDLHPREAAQALTAAVIQVAGPELQDDATVLVIDWYGPGRTRGATAGATDDRAST